MRTLLFAIGYIILIPLVAGACLWASVTYFPSQTREFLGPILEKVVGASETRVEEKVSPLVRDLLKEEMASISSRLDRIEEKVAGLSQEAASAAPTEEGQSHPGPSDEALALLSREITAKERVSAALSGLTLARFEYLQGNRGTCQRELRLVESILARIPALADDLKNMLAKSIEEVAKDSPQAADWLSLTWHRLLEEMSGKSEPSPK